MREGSGRAAGRDERRGGVGTEVLRCASIPYMARRFLGTPGTSCSRCSLNVKPRSSRSPSEGWGGRVKRKAVKTSGSGPGEGRAVRPTHSNCQTLRDFRLATALPDDAPRRCCQALLRDCCCQSREETVVARGGVGGMVDDSFRGAVPLWYGLPSPLGEDASARMLHFVPNNRAKRRTTRRSRKMSSKVGPRR